VAAFLIIFVLKEPLMFLINNYTPQVQNLFFGGQIANEIIQKLVKLVIFGLLFLVACFVYFVLLFVLKTFGKEELDILEAALRKARVPEKYISIIRNFFEAKWFKLPRT